MKTDCSFIQMMEQCIRQNDSATFQRALQSLHPQRRDFKFKTTIREPIKEYQLGNYKNHGRSSEDALNEDWQILSLLVILAEYYF